MKKRAVDARAEQWTAKTRGAELLIADKGQLSEGVVAPVQQKLVILGKEDG